VRLDVDSAGYVSACNEFYNANHGVVDGVVTLSVAVDGCGALAGSDTGGQEWAQQYDAVAGPLVRAGGDVGEALGKMANLLNASLRNHEGADYGSRMYGSPTAPAAADDPDSNHYSSTLAAPAPPSAFGGTGDQPGWWHRIAGHIGGLLWPDADTGRLNSAGSAWITAGASVAVWTSAVDGAAAQVGVQRSPEVPDVVATCHDPKGHLTDLSDAYTQVGRTCQEYAKYVDDHHSEMENELADFVKWTIGIEVGGAIIGILTLGAGETAAQAAEAAEVASAASRVIRILQKLLGLARLCASKIGELVATITRISARLKSILNARAVAALERVAPSLVQDSRASLLRELEQQGVKHTPADIVKIFRDPGGKIVFLEKGDSAAGLRHIVGRHGAQLTSKGVPESKIPDLIETAITGGKLLGYQGRGVGRPIYEVLFEGKILKIAITASSNGYVVGMNVR